MKVTVRDIPSANASGLRSESAIHLAKPTIDLNTAPYAVLLLRVSLGSLFLAHGLLKIFVFTLPGTAQFFSSVGLPGLMAYPVTLLEIVGGIGLLVGFYSRWIAIALFPILLVATFKVHFESGWLFTNENGGWEFPAFFAAATVVQFLLGDGAYALSTRRKQRR
ncbi:MAG: DoxX family protein [Cyanobacteria bacterium J06634_5]